DDRQFEAIVELSQSDWDLLDHPIAGKQARLFMRNGEPLGAARIRQGGGFLDQRTRQPRIFLEIANPGDGVLAGDFVRVEFTGRALANTVTIPESSLSRAGAVWFVDSDDRLSRIQPDILFRSGGSLTIAAPDTRASWRVVLTPLASFIPGQRVTPQPLRR
ncbi:efflux RND transporter periplasmic adaptor subunit, partial [Devosia indica]